MNSNERQAVGYGRVSTERQADQGVSLDAQKLAVSRFCETRSMELVDYFSDDGISGKATSNRPALELALQLVCERRGVLIVYSLSRMSRSVRDVFMVVDRMRESGADFVSVTETIDTTSAIGRAFFHVVAILAQLESDLTGERVALANRYTVERLGYRTQGIQPFGFSIGKSGERVEATAERAIVNMIIEMRRDGCTLNEIADRLNTQGNPTLTVRRKYKRRSSRWHSGTLYRILRRTAPELCNIGFRRKNRPISAEEIKLLGTDTDAKIAMRTGRHRPFICRERVRRGIPPFAGGAE